MNVVRFTCDGTVNTVHNYASRRFLWPRGLRRESAASRLLGFAGSNSARGHRYLSVVSVVCCQVEISASG